MSSEQQIRVGFTQDHPCNYLADRSERVAVVIDPELNTPKSYEMLLANGFRRSGKQVYLPQCRSCNACESIRVQIDKFSLSKSQKRLLNKAKCLSWQMKDELDDEWFELYSRYIIKRHSSGNMFPPNKTEFFNFIQCDWLPVQFLHIYSGSKLVAVAITDVMSQCASAFYTFFDPDTLLSLGTIAVLFQIEYCQNEGKNWLYLGYQIDECPAMNYKVRFRSHQRLVNRRWQG